MLWVKTDSKWITDVKLKTIELQVNINREGNLYNLEWRSLFRYNNKDMILKEIIDKLDLIKIKASALWKVILRELDGSHRLGKYIDKRQNLIKDYNSKYTEIP